MMKDKLAVHRQIEEENRRKLEAWKENTMVREMIGPMPKMEAENMLRYFKAAASFMLEIELVEFEDDLIYHSRYTSWNDEQTKWIIEQIKKELAERKVA